jgi:hypothetical protein
MPPTGKHFKYLYNSTLGALIPAISLSQFVRSAQAPINHGSASSGERIRVLPLVGIGRKNAVGRLWTFKEDFSKGFRALWRADDSGVTLRSSRFTLKIHRPGQTKTQSMQVLSVNSKTPKTSGKSTQEASTTSVARKAALTECLSPPTPIFLAQVLGAEHAR